MNICQTLKHEKTTRTSRAKNSGGKEMSIMSNFPASLGEIFRWKSENTINIYVERQCTDINQESSYLGIWDKREVGRFCIGIQSW